MHKHSPAFVLGTCRYTTICSMNLGQKVISSVVRKQFKVLNLKLSDF